MTQQITAYHEYKVYARDGTYKGTLPNVTSPFRYRQTIGTVGAALIITVGQTMDIASQPVVPIETETPESITTEQSQVITTETAVPLVGAANSDALIANDNIIIVYEYSNWYPNGVIVYQGYISSWSGVLGGEEDITINCFSDGQDMQHYLTPGTTTDVADQIQTNYNSANYFNLYETGTYQRSMQTFTPGASADNVSKIILKLAVIGGGSRTATVEIWRNDQNVRTDVPLATSSKSISGTTPTDYTFVYPTPAEKPEGINLLFTVKADSSSTSSKYVRIYGSSGNVYAGGAWYVYNPTTLVAATNDTYFTTYYNTPTTENTYTNQDVSTGMLDPIMDYYLSGGGEIGKQSGGFAATGVVTTYTFKINTILEAMRKISDLGPSNWYWYVDVADKVLVYKQTSVTADLPLVKGRDITEFSIEANKEDIINVSYFSGGDDGTGSGENIFVNVNDADSLAVNRRGMSRISDNRVFGTDGIDAGTLLAQNEIDQHPSEEYAIEVEVKTDTIDITLYKLGKTVRVTGTNTFVDTLILQIVEVDRRATSAILRLGYPRKRSSAKVESLQQQLSDIQTIDNPTQPS